MGAPQCVLCSHGVLNAVDFLLVTPAVHHGTLLGIPQCSLQGLNSLSSRPKTFLQLWKLTTQICIVTNQLVEEEGEGRRDEILMKDHLREKHKTDKKGRWKIYNTYSLSR